MKIIALDSFHSVLYKRVSNFFLTQVWVFYCKNLLFLPTKRLKYSFKSPTFSKILVSKKIWRRACRAKNCLIAHFFFYYSSKLLYSWPSIFTFYIYMLYIYLLYLFFLKILIWFDYVIDKKQIKKNNIYFRIMISSLFSLCYIHFLQSFFQKTGHGIFYCKLILRKKDFKFSHSKNLFRLFKTIGRCYRYCFTINIMDYIL